MHVNRGNSGGPVYCIDIGAVIGLCDAHGLDDNVMLYPSPGSTGKPEQAYDANNRVFMTNAGLGVVIPAKYVVELLKKNNLNWTEKRFSVVHDAPSTAGTPDSLCIFISP